MVKNGKQQPKAVNKVKIRLKKNVNKGQKWSKTVESGQSDQKWSKR